MTPFTFHPAILQLLWLQSRGRRRRMWRRVCQPRRLVLSTLACVLAVAWLGNAALTVWLREQASPTTLRALLSLGLAVYAMWHFAKAAFFRPESPFDWTPAERDLLAAMPLLPRDLVAYQVASVTVTTVLKATLFTVLLLPDLRSVPLGFTGLLSALLVLEMIRMAVDIATWGMGRAAYLLYRCVVAAGLIAAGFVAAAVAVREQAFTRINLGEGVLDRVLEILVQLNTSLFSYVALPFQPFVRLIVADRITPANAMIAAADLAIVTMLAVAVVGLYTVMARHVASRIRRNYRPTDPGHDASALHERREQTPSSTALSGRLGGRFTRRIPHWGGAGAIAWRQMLGARRHWGGLLTAMIAPAVLACIPCFVIADPAMAFLSTACTLAFYTFLLLPTALYFDFRRDLDRLALLKGLPIAPAAVVVGQTLTPVLIATLFQTGMLAFAIVARSLPPHYLVAAMLVLIPINVVVFAFDNLIYLLYPYRLHQEGLEIFLRTMLTFTGKGLIFAAALAAMTAWGFTAAVLTHSMAAWTGLRIDAHVVFFAGMIAGPSALAAFILRGLARVYRQMDPIADVPR